MRKKEIKSKKVSELQLILTVLFVSCLLISNVLTAKQVKLPFNITMTGAVIIFPITYILSDIFSEVYGYRWSRITSYIGFAMNLLMVIVFSIVIVSPAPDHWKNQEAFQVVLGSTPRVLFASLVAYLVGDYVNDNVFRKMKEKHIDDHKKFGLRAILSSLVGELADSLIFLPIAFIGVLPLKVLAIMTITQVLIKTGYELLMLPVTRIIVHKVSSYEKGIK
jgi:hypothetical protein